MINERERERERERLLEGCSQKEIWVLREPLFWVIVWSHDLFFIKRKKKKENTIHKSKNSSNSLMNYT